MGDADGPEVRHALLRTLGLRAYETHTGGGACGWLAVGGTMRALTPEEIRHDPWDAADGADQARVLVQLTIRAVDAPNNADKMRRHKS